MTTDTLTITDFLLARIAEDEVMAQAADEVETGLIHAAIRANTAARGRAADMAHIARWDPARVLAECKAKRAIVELHRYGSVFPDSVGWCEACDADQSWPCDTITAVAAVYSDHPDHQSYWAG